MKGREKEKKRKEGVDWDINRGSEPCRNGSPAEDMKEREAASLTIACLWTGQTTRPIWRQCCLCHVLGLTQQEIQMPKGRLSSATSEQEENEIGT